MEQEKERLFLHEKIDKLIDHSKDLVSCFGVEAILYKSIERKTKNGLPTLSMESLSKYLIKRSWNYAFNADTKHLLHNEVADFCDRLQYFSNIPVNAPEEDIVDFLENKNFSKIREFFPHAINEFLEAAEMAFRVPEDENNVKAIYKNNRKKDTKEITSGYVYDNYSETTLRECIDYIKEKTKKLVGNAPDELDRATDDLAVNSEVLRMAKEIILKLVADCEGKSGFQKGTSFICNEIIPQIDDKINELMPREVECLKMELTRLVEPIGLRIPDGFSFQIEIRNNQVSCIVKDY